MNEKNKILTGTGPNVITGGQFFGKFLVGLLVGGIITVLLFIILSVIGGNLSTSMVENSASPILPLLLIIIGFITSFIGNLGIVGLYSLFFSKRYNSTRKMIGLLLLTNGILFILLLPVYILFSKTINTLFIILGFHIIISVFLSSQQIETICNANYSASSLIGNTLSLTIIMLFYGIIWKTASLSDIQSQLYLLILFPPVLAFGIMPIGLSIRETIYQGMFERGNNCFYVQSQGEMTEKELENFDKNDITKGDIEEDINIDLG